MCLKCMESQILHALNAKFDKFFFFLKKFWIYKHKTALLLPGGKILTVMKYWVVYQIKVWFFSACELPIRQMGKDPYDSSASSAFRQQ